MYYPSSENKGADQLRGYREADLHLCFRPCKLLVFSRTGSYAIIMIYSSDMPGIQETDDTTQALLLIDTAGCDLHDLDLPEEISKGNEGIITLLKYRPGLHWW